MGVRSDGRGTEAESGARAALKTPPNHVVSVCFASVCSHTLKPQQIACSISRQWRFAVPEITVSKTDDAILSENNGTPHAQPTTATYARTVTAKLMVCLTGALSVPLLKLELAS